jgi:transposase
VVKRIYSEPFGLFRPDFADVRQELTVGTRCIAGLARQVLDLQARLNEIERELLAWHRSNDIAKRLATIPGIGTVCATALVASVTDPNQFRSGRQFAAWLRLTPLQHSSGGKERQGRISKMGDKCLRRLLVVGMTSLIRRARYKPEALDPWLADLLTPPPYADVAPAASTASSPASWQ